VPRPISPDEALSLAPGAVETMAAIMEDEDASPSDRLKAATAIADRTGLHAVSEQKKTVEHNGDNPDQLKRIAALCHALGIDPAMLLGHRLALQVPMIDMTPVEKEPAQLDDPFAGEEY